jgi:glutathione S-transferase
VSSPKDEAVPRLYHRWKCPWSAAARQAIENVGAFVELVEVPYDREEREAVMGTSGQRRVPVLVDGDEVVVDSRRIVRHVYSRYGDDSFARSIAELDRDIASDGDMSSSVADASTVPAPGA